MYNNLLCQSDYCMVNHSFIMHGGPAIMGVLGCCGGDLWEMIGCFMTLIEEMIRQGNEGRDEPWCVYTAAQYTCSVLMIYRSNWITLVQVRVYAALIVSLLSQLPLRLLMVE